MLQDCITTAIHRADPLRHFFACATCVSLKTWRGYRRPRRRARRSPVAWRACRSRWRWPPAERAARAGHSWIGKAAGPSACAAEAAVLWSRPRWWLQRGKNKKEESVVIVAKTCRTQSSLFSNKEFYFVKIDYLTKKILNIWVRLSTIRNKLTHLIIAEYK